MLESRSRSECFRTAFSGPCRLKVMRDQDTCLDLGLYLDSILLEKENFFEIFRSRCPDHV